MALLPLGKRKNELTQVAKLMFAEDFAGRVLPFDEKAATAFAEIAAKRRRMGKPISQADAQIASICYSQQATLVTRNISDFEDCDIAIINPWEVD
ncbi:PIN domain-containing protein [Okeania sp.]|uniref:PIN domain-containing protein n=1 Tax=Okeania sp. TaxID=3100323 RepID=UPI002B4AC492|nr:PIN domain-containing protein [Okeania sp.]MEB3343587.1 PIN domain-containing protein [Okeania sp.]